MLTDYFKHTVALSRPTTVDRKKTYAVVASFSAHIQPLADNFGEGVVNRTSQNFLMFSKTEVLIGDKLEDQNGKQYEVVGVATMEFRRGVRHYESTLHGV